MAVILETSLGDITIDLYVKERPRCSENFLKLCKVKYFNWCLFHNVQRNLVAQTGDPSGTGRGGSSVYAKVFGDQATCFDQELKPVIKHKKKGTISMVNNGSGMHGSQFFITLAADIDYLDGVHTPFGEVAEGFDVLDKINEAIVDDDSRPYRDIRIFHTVVLDDPFPDMKGLAEFIPDRSPEPTREQLESGLIAVDEEVDEMEGKTKEEIDEMLSEKEARANAQLLELVGDIPDAEIEAPDTVLFVCKLNPVTTDEDLEVIFSRFGEIVSCEVIKDHKTGESLQYAFIEFARREDCENAFFKMDNVLIDDRRIHVDFSQSVSKLRSIKGKGGSSFQGIDGTNYIIKDQQRKEKYNLVIDEDKLAGQLGKNHKSNEKTPKDHNNKGRERSPKRFGKERLERKEESTKRYRSTSKSPDESRSSSQKKYERERYQRKEEPTKLYRSRSKSPEESRERSPKRNEMEKYERKEKPPKRYMSTSKSPEESRERRNEKERYQRKEASSKRYRSRSPEHKRYQDSGKSYSRKESNTRNEYRKDTRDKRY